jgi:hypothetical protein
MCIHNLYSKHTRHVKSTENFLIFRSELEEWLWVLCCSYSFILNKITRDNSDIKRWYNIEGILIALSDETTIETDMLRGLWVLWENIW